MDIHDVIEKAQGMYANDNLIFPEHCGVLEMKYGYWVEASVWVPISLCENADKEADYRWIS
jgi:hypothetical protein